MTDWLALATDICRPTTLAVTQDIETRFIQCLDCGGDGGWETLTHYDPRDGSPCGYWTTCGACAGSGEMEIAVEPIEMEDLP